MSRNTVVGIDIGTYHVKVVIASRDEEASLPRIIGTGFAESRGLRHGYISNEEDAVDSIRAAVREAERAAGIKVRSALASLGGIGLGSTVGVGTIVTSRADSEITELDIQKSIDTAQEDISKGAIINRRILHTIPLQYRVDGKVTLGRPVGLVGTKLETRVHFITCLEHHIEDLLGAIADAGVHVDPEDLIAAPLAASVVTLGKTQKIAGVVLANIGSETVSIIVFENGLPVSLEVLPLGSSDITNDIALGFRIPLDEAEDLKRGSLVGVTYPKRRLEEIVSARLSDIFDLIEAHLKKIGRSGLLPAGIVLTGGGAGLELTEALARTTLRLPARVATVKLQDQTKSIVKENAWVVAYGLTVLALSKENDGAHFGAIARQAGGNIAKWFRQFLP